MTSVMRYSLIAFLVSGCAVLRDPYLYEEAEDVIERIVEDESKED